MNIPFKILDERLLEDMPLYKSPVNAGMDLRAMVEKDLYLHPGQDLLVPTGFAMRVPKGHFAMVVPRSGMGANVGIVLGNLVGVIDEDYGKEVFLKLWNRNDEGRAVHIKAMERVAQMVIVPCLHFTPEIVQELPDSGRAGFGSSGRM